MESKHVQIARAALHTKCRKCVWEGVEGWAWWNCLKHNKKATVIKACWHSTGGSLLTVRRWSSASSDRNLTQLYLTHWFQLRGEETLCNPYLLSALSTLASHHLLQLQVWYKRNLPNLTISTLLNWHVIKRVLSGRLSEVLFLRSNCGIRAAPFATLFPSESQLSLAFWIMTLYFSTEGLK